jgi:hypothetical protein
MTHVAQHASFEEHSQSSANENQSSSDGLFSFIEGRLSREVKNRKANVAAARKPIS